MMGWHGEHRVDSAKFLVQHMAAREKQRAERLVLC